MELSEFTRALEAMSELDIHAVAAGLDAHTRTPADEIQMWHAIITIDRELRRRRRTREAALASLVASRAVLGAAGHAGIALPDAEVTRVARAASEVARALVAGGPIDADVDRLLSGWASLFRPLRPAA